MPPKNKVQPSISRFFKKGTEQEIEDPKKERVNGRKESHLSTPTISNLAKFNHATEETPNPVGKRKLENGSSAPKLSKMPKSDNEPAQAPEESKQQTAKKLTPLEKQFINLKRQHMDKILAIQVGYKFKFFGEDARIASKVLNIMLIPGNESLDVFDYDRFAYSSIPDNRLHVHLKRLLYHGFKVGVVKQTETAAIKSMESNNKSGLFDREMTGVYTKATYLDDEITTGEGAAYEPISGTEGMGDYILCVNELNSNKFGMISVRPSTGDIIYDEFADSNMREELEIRLLQLAPSEVLVLSDKDSVSDETMRILKFTSNTATVIHRKLKTDAFYSSQINSLFSGVEESKRKEVANFYLLNFPPEVQSCIYEMADYLKEFKLANIFTIISNVSPFSNTERYMHLPSSTIHSLELFQNTTEPNSNKGTMIWLLDHTRTKMGYRKLLKWIAKPLINKEDIADRLDAVEFLNTNIDHLTDSIKSQLDKIRKQGIDLEKSLIKVHYSAAYKSEKVSRKELYSMIKCFFEILRVIKDFEQADASRHTKISSKIISLIFRELFELSSKDIIGYLYGVISPRALEEQNLLEQKLHFFNLKNYQDEDIIEQLNKVDEVKDLLQEELKEVRKVLNRPNLNYVTNLKEEYLIEVRNGKMVDMLPDDWIKISGTKTVSRFRSPNITALYKRLQYHNDMLIKCCDKAYGNFLLQVDSHYGYFRNIINNLSEFDCLLSLSIVSTQNMGYARPFLINEDNQNIDITKGRNPIIEKFSFNRNYIANDIKMSQGRNRVMMITGPNMGGKSSYVKQVALLVIMVQIGSYIPCESAKMGVFDSIFIRMGARDHLLANQSTFMVEMLETNNILKNMNPRSLIILDEIGRGTGTVDGIAIAFAILKYTIEEEKKPFVLFITHFPSLHVLEEAYKGIVTNYHMGYYETSKPNQDFREVIFLYTLVKGVVTNLYGLNVAKLAGIPTSVLKKAYSKSEEMRNKVERDQWQSSFIRTIKALKENRKANLSEIDKLLGENSMPFD